MKRLTKDSQSRKLTTLAAALLISVAGFSQQFYDDSDTTRTEVVKTEKVKKSSQEEIRTLTSNGHNGGFMGLTFKATEFNNEPTVTMGFRMGWIFGRTIGFGVEGHGLVPSAKYNNIIPNESVYALGGYGGLFLEPVLFSNRVFHFTFPVAAGAGWMGYHEDWDTAGEVTNLVDDDTYWYLEPGISAEINVTKNFRLAFGASQRFTQELDLINTSPQAFDNRNYHVTLKFGRF